MGDILKFPSALKFRDDLHAELDIEPLDVQTALVLTSLIITGLEFVDFSEEEECLLQHLWENISEVLWPDGE